MARNFAFINRDLPLKSRKYRRISAQFWRATRAQRLQNSSQKRRSAYHEAKSIWNESARFSCVLRARLGPKLRTFALEIHAILRAKPLKISALVATDARTRHKKDTDDHSTHDAQDAQVFLSSAMLYVAKFAFINRDFGWNRAIFDDFGRNFAARHAPGACQSIPERARVHGTASKVFGMSLRASRASCAHARHRNCAILRSKFARFCMQTFEN